MNRKEYQPLPGFFDLRNFTLTKKEFASALRIQQFLSHCKRHNSYYLKMHNREWEEVQQLSAQLQQFLLSRLKP